MSALESLLQDWLDDPLIAARDAAAAGRRVIGCVGPDIPVELILAAGAVPARLRCNVDAATPQADRYLERSFSPASRSLAEQWLTGQLDFLTALVLPRTDDSLQRLYYYLCELQRRGATRGPRPLLYDLATVQRASSLAHSIRSTQLLATQLGVTAPGLRTAVERVRARSQSLSRLQELRKQPAVPAGSLALQILHAGECCWTEKFDTALAAWLDAPTLLQPARRLMLVGSDPPDPRIHAAVEAGGAIIVDEISEAARHAGAGVGRSAIEAIAVHYHDAGRAARTLMQSPRVVRDRVRAMRADGVILWLTETDTGIAWEVPLLLQILSDAGIACLPLLRQPWFAERTVLEQVSEFARMPVSTP